MPDKPLTEHELYEAALLDDVEKRLLYQLALVRRMKRYGISEKLLYKVIPDAWGVAFTGAYRLLYFDLAEAKRFFMPGMTSPKEAVSEAKEATEARR